MQSQRQLDTPIGPVTVTVREDAVTALHLAAGRDQGPDIPLMGEALRQISEYFRGFRQQFDLPLRQEGTPFQQQVWTALRRLEYGHTCSYGDLARELGLPIGAARAIGQANGRNRLPILVPCHRVLAAGGKIGGYGGGLSVKRWLLDHERHAATTVPRSPAATAPPVPAPERPYR